VASSLTNIQRLAISCWALLQKVNAALGTCLYDKYPGGCNPLPPPAKAVPVSSPPSSPKPTARQPSKSPKPKVPQTTPSPPSPTKVSRSSKSMSRTIVAIICAVAAIALCAAAIMLAVLFVRHRALRRACSSANSNLNKTLSTKSAARNKSNPLYQEHEPPDGAVSRVLGSRLAKGKASLEVGSPTHALSSRSLDSPQFWNTPQTSDNGQAALNRSVQLEDVRADGAAAVAAQSTCELRQMSRLPIQPRPQMRQHMQQGRLPRGHLRDTRAAADIYIAVTPPNGLTRVAVKVLLLPLHCCADHVRQSQLGRSVWSSTSCL
jgi:hypothetical protein